MSDTGDNSSGLIRLAIERPVSVAAAVLLTLFFGLLAVVDLPIQLTPDITQPTVTVSTLWPGASPLEVEAEILEPQEEVLERVAGLLEMESTATSNQGEITLEFEVGTDLDQALVRVANQLSQVPRYPDTAEQPVVTTARAVGPPLAVILVRRPEGGSVDTYRTWVEEEIVPELERLDGVASVFMRGGRTSEIQINFDTQALAARHLTVPSVAARIRQELSNASAGELDIGKRSMLVRTLAVRDIADFEELVLSVGTDNTPVLLRDVADVQVGLRRATDFAIGDNRDSIALLPRREAGSNVLEVTEAIQRTVQRLDEEEFAREGLKFEVVDDQSGYIYDALELVRTNLLVGALLATLVLLLFLRSFATAFVIALAIPLCVLTTALGMALLGRSVNVVSLAGVTFAVGMVVDNSIVALENIDTWRSRLSDAKRAAFIGIKEVWGALVASTATTAAVFIPILVWEGEVGELLRDIAYAIALAVSISLVVSILVIPSFTAVLIQHSAARKQPTTKAAFWRLLEPVARFGERLRTGLTQLSEWCASGVTRPVTITALGTVLAALVVIQMLPKMEYLPTGNRNLVFGVVLPPPGLSVEELRKVGHQNQDIMWQHTDKSVDGVPAVHRSFFVGTPSLLFIGGVAQNPDEVSGMRDFMRGLHAQIPGSIGFASQAALFSRGIGEGRAVELEISGADLRQLIGVGGRLFGELQRLVPGAQVRPVPVLDLGAPEFRFVPNRAQAMALSFSQTDLALIIDAYVDGAILGEFGNEGERKLDVVLRHRGRGFDDLRLLDAAVAAPGGRIVPLSVLGSLETQLGPTVIQRNERERTVVLQLTPPDEVPFEQAIDAVSQRVQELQQAGSIDPGVKLRLGGSAGKLSEAQRQFTWILVIAFVILFLLLAALFEDFVAPWVILTTVPLAAAGGVLGLSLSNAFLGAQPLDLMGALGFLILFGVVVNNAILIVDGALQRLREGAPLAEATASAVRSRVRPIFMSTLTSLAGLLPMVLSSGSGSELYRGVGTIVLGGLTVSTVLSLFIVPALFVLLWRLRRRVMA
jgi:hydrophobic/amphiphilic exporter-1 (mainly G- bacteria), HAE1 family